MGLVRNGSQGPWPNFSPLASRIAFATHVLAHSSPARGGRTRNPAGDGGAATRDDIGGGALGARARGSRTRYSTFCKRSGAPQPRRRRPRRRPRHPPAPLRLRARTPSVTTRFSSPLPILLPRIAGAECRDIYAKAAWLCALRL